MKNYEDSFVTYVLFAAVVFAIPVIAYING